MQFKFKKGKHRAVPLYWLKWFPFLFNAKCVARRVMFTFDTAYALDKGDQEDRNKLFGVSYCLSPKKFSARYSFWYNPDNKLFEVNLFCHVKGEMIFDYIFSAEPYVEYDLYLIITDNDYVFRAYRVHDQVIMCSVAIGKGHNKKMALLLGAYFGGNRTPGRSLTFHMSRISADLKKALFESKTLV